MPTSAQLAISAVGGLGLAAGAFHYAALWPASQLFGRSIIAGHDPAELALTYDDGPNEPYTAQLMEILARHQVHATFFVIGRYVRQKPELVRALYQDGHTIGGHTMTHPALMYKRAAQIRAEIADSTALIEDTIGARVRYFRPPFGSRNPAVFGVLRELDLTPVLWNVTTRDWSANSTEEVERHLYRGIARNQRRRRGSNILMHDGSHIHMQADRSHTVAATANLLDSAGQRGMRIVSLDGWPPPARG